MQVPLNFPKTISYSRKNYFCHQGVAALYEQVLSRELSSSSATKKAVIIEASNRSGKTHFLIALSQDLDSQGKKNLLLNLEELLKFDLNIDWLELLPAYQYCLLDDFDLLIDECLRWNKVSLVVDLFESAKRLNIDLILSSSKGLGDFSDLDPQILSRLKAAIWLEISKPAENELPLVLDLMAKQRGVKFSEKQIKFLCVRLRQDIASIERYINRLLSWTEVAGEPIKQTNISSLLN